MTNLVYRDRTIEIFNEVMNRPNLRLLAIDFATYRPESYLHSMEVGILSIDIASGYPVFEPHLINIGIGAIFHDIGKLTTPEEIIEKKGPLTLEEELIMREHVKQSYLILLGAGYSEPAEFALRHHDHKANPRIPTTEKEYLGEPTNSIVQLIAAADVFNALLKGRPYKKAYTLDEVREKIFTEYTGDPKYAQEALRRA